MRLLPLVVVCTVVLVGCSDDPTTPEYDSDPIADLTVTVTSPHGAQLDWTAPSVVGSWAGSYEIRYREESFAADDWDDATALASVPLPDTPEEPQSHVVYGLPAGTSLVFRMRHERDGWYSGLSNAAVAEMPDGEPIPDGFAYVPAGTYTIGSAVDEIGRDDDEASHDVVLSQATFVAICEVTQAEYLAITGEEPSHYEGTDQPVEQVSWFDAVAYCNARSLAEGLAPAYETDGLSVSWDREANGFRLPTEAEWEVACRAGSAEAFCSGSTWNLGCAADDILSLVGVYCGTDVDGDNTNEGDLDGPDGPDDVGERLANAWGIKDMHGNVFEWCWDWYAAGVEAADLDPVGPEVGTNRVIRGGGFSSPIEACRSAARSARGPSMSSYGVGFRVVRSAN